MVRDIIKNLGIEEPRKTNIRKEKEAEQQAFVNKLLSERQGSGGQGMKNGK